MNRSTPVLLPLTPEARNACQGEEIKLHKLPFRIGRENRVTSEKQVKRKERRKLTGTPNNDLYLIDNGKFLNVSREHFQIDKKEDGTYELCGKKVQGNPENIEGHKLIKHGSEVLSLEDDSFEYIKQYLTENDIEGIVFHHRNDDRMCKIRKSDFGIKR